MRLLLEGRLRSCAFHDLVEMGYPCYTKLTSSEAVPDVGEVRNDGVIRVNYEPAFKVSLPFSAGLHMCP